MPQRHASLIGIRPEKLDEYKRLHAAVWPEVLAKITQSGIRNYSICLRELPDGPHYLVSYFEHVGNDFDAAMAKFATDPKTQEWWALCKPCQKSLSNRAEGEWLSDMEDVFHAD